MIILWWLENDFLTFFKEWEDKEKFETESSGEEIGTKNAQRARLNCIAKRKMEKGADMWIMWTNQKQQLARKEGKEKRVQSRKKEKRSSSRKKIRKDIEKCHAD